MGEYINVTKMIDSDTGEVLKENSWIGYDGFSEKGYKYRNRQTHIKFFNDSIPDNLSEDAWLLLIMLAEMMNDDNMLVYRVERKSRFSNNVYRAYDKDEIRDKLRFRMGQNKFDRVWREISKHCVKRIRYYSIVAWAVNPTVVNKCREIPFWLCEEFIDYIAPHVTAATLKKLNNKISNYHD